MDYQSEILIALVTTRPRRASRAREMIPMSHCVNGKRGAGRETEKESTENGKGWRRDHVPKKR